MACTCIHVDTYEGTFACTNMAPKHIKTPVSPKGHAAAHVVYRTSASIYVTVTHDPLASHTASLLQAQTITNCMHAWDVSSLSLSVYMQYVHCQWQSCAVAAET